jgi:hypothetical protein
VRENIVIGKSYPDGFNMLRLANISQWGKLLKRLEKKYGKVEGV